MEVGVAKPSAQGQAIISTPYGGNQRHRDLTHDVVPDDEGGDRVFLMA
jgi:hypothetical protein